MISFAPDGILSIQYIGLALLKGISLLGETRAYSATEAVHNPNMIEHNISSISLTFSFRKRRMAYGKTGPTAKSVYRPITILPRIKES